MDEAGCPIAWVVADTVYGGNLDLRTWLQAHGYQYVLAVACTEPVGIRTPDGQRRRVHVDEVPALLLQEHEWQRLSMSEGTKGPRLFDWAVVPLLHQWEDDGQHWLLIRRSLTNPQEQCYYLVFAAPGTTLQEMVKAIGARWHIEEAFENAKDLGLDHYEVRSFLGWYRHVTLVMLAMAYLAGMCREENVPLLCVATLPTEPLTLLVLPLTVPEVRHLLGHLIWPTPRNMPRALAWSRWRRGHQSRASYFHTKRRLDAG
jgi:SRSO17 transposase